MREIRPERRFLKDMKKLERRGYDLRKLNAIIAALLADEPLPPNARPHKLSGQVRDIWDIHVANDWVLLYEITDEYLALHRTGTHADLF